MIIRKINKKTSEEKKRVAAYCRVSTQKDEQEDSFEVQKDYYSNYISNNPDWIMGKIYSDKHSATSVENRPGFQEMMADAKERKIDLILVKSISRFARNVVDCQVYLQRLKSYGCDVYFEKENIHTDDTTSSFILSLMSAIAQDESHSISMNVKMGYRSRYKRGEYNLGSNRVLGYDCINGKLAPNKDAETVREIFRRFMEGQTYREIADGVSEMGAVTLRGKTRLSPETIRYMLGNETYVGDKLLQKKAPRDYLTKKPDPNIPYESVYLSDDHEAIIDKDTWNQVQDILHHREEAAEAGIYKRSKEHHILYGKLFCGECGAPFIRRTYRNGNEHYKAWNCKERQKGSKGNGCKNAIVKEDFLMQDILDKLGWDAINEEQFLKINKIMVYKNRIDIV